MSVSSGPYLKIQCSTNALATFSAVIVRRGTTCVNRSVITSMNRIFHFVVVSGPSMSMATERNGTVAGNKARVFVPLSKTYPVFGALLAVLHGIEDVCRHMGPLVRHT